MYTLTSFWAKLEDLGNQVRDVLNLSDRSQNRSETVDWIDATRSGIGEHNAPAPPLQIENLQRGCSGERSVKKKLPVVSDIWFQRSGLVASQGLALSDVRVFGKSSREGKVSKRQRSLENNSSASEQLCLAQRKVLEQKERYQKAKQFLRSGTISRDDLKIIQEELDDAMWQWSMSERKVRKLIRKQAREDFQNWHLRFSTVLNHDEQSPETS